MRACASGWSQRYPVRGECPMLGRESRSISHNHDDGDDNDCGDQRKRTIECFRGRPCEGHFERRHDMAPSAHLLPRPASFCRNQPLTIGRSAQQARLLECLGPLRPGRLIFAHGASLRWERYELPVTDNWSILLIFHNLCLAGLGRDARRWRLPKRGVGRRLTGYTPTACPLKRHMADCERGLLVLAERRRRL